jgi:acetyltransferase-like isoleucine patch superfamily enzyme
MRGRDWFKAAKVPISILESLTAVLPEPCVALAWLIVKPMPTKVGIGLRYVLLRRLAAECGHIVSVAENVYLFQPGNLKMGNNVSIHSMSYIDCSGGITIGDNVSIAHGVTIMSSEHSFNLPGVPIREAPVRFEPVNIGSDVWIGAGAKILAGVTINDRTVIGAGAVVTRDIPSNSVAAGIPARVIRVIG